MAWRCSGRTHVELIRNLCDAGIIVSSDVRHAMQCTDRALYVSSSSGSSRAYDDAPQEIPRPANVTARATISAPHMHAYALEVMAPYLSRSRQSAALDVGCGSGYLTACLARLVGAQGTVVAVDHLTYLTTLTRTNLSHDLSADELGENVKIVTRDGRLGVVEYGPYDAIHVGAAAAGQVPSVLVEQLKSPGIMFVPVGEADGQQYIYIVQKDEHGTVTQQQAQPVRYVPLTDAETD